MRSPGQAAQTCTTPKVSLTRRSAGSMAPCCCCGTPGHHLLKIRHPLVTTTRDDDPFLSFFCFVLIYSCRPFANMQPHSGRPIFACHQAAPPSHTTSSPPNAPPCHAEALANGPPHRELFSKLEPPLVLFSTGCVIMKSMKSIIIRKHNVRSEQSEEPL